MSDLPQNLPGVIDQLGTDEFSTALMHWLHGTVRFDGFVLLGYPESGELAVFHDGAPAADHVSCTSVYRGGMWLFSPLYLHARQGHKGFFHISDISGPDFTQSEFYTRYYEEVGINDHLAYIAENGAGEALVVSIERSTALPAFTQAEQDTLRELEPLVSSLVRKNWPSFSQQTGVKQAFHSSDHSELIGLLGDRGLTPREEEALLALLKGLPNKLIARELDISVETVKVYCKNIMRKFGVSSRGELFARILEKIVIGEQPSAEQPGLQ
jgi:DNA-binding CsgD family transcriptional regulator